MTPRISSERLLSDIAGLARIGGREDGGVDRLAGTEADLEGRRWLARRMREAGLEATLDEVNNVFGRPAGAVGPFLLLGSHTDTVPAGGRLDGAYGVLAALEVARTLRESGLAAAERVAVASFHDEEGVSGNGFEGSLFFCAGPRLADVMGYLELHIEQGPRLEAEGLVIGAVEGIVGIDRHRLEFRGEPNHAGTTPFEMRRDAGRASVRLLAGLRELVQLVDPDMVANAGEIAFHPGAPNVVPGKATTQVEFRALRPESLARSAEALRFAAERIAGEEGCEVSVELLTSWPAVALDPKLVGAVEAACVAGGRPWGRLVSGAGHDAEILARHVPAAMIFVPSHRGISHSPLEYTEPEHLAFGCQTLLDSAILALAKS